MIDLRRVVQRLVRRAVPAPSVARPPGESDVIRRLPATHQAAAASLVDFYTIESLPFRRRLLVVSREGLRPEIEDFTLKFLKALHKRGIPFFLHCGLRTRGEQQRLFTQGVSKARPGESPHQYGAAVDLVHFGKYWDLTPLQWAVVGAIGKEVARKCNLKIEWGGDWDFFDPAHWQLENWREYK